MICEALSVQTGVEDWQMGQCYNTFAWAWSARTDAGKFSMLFEILKRSDEMLKDRIWCFCTLLVSIGVQYAIDVDIKTFFLLLYSTSKFRLKQTFHSGTRGACWVLWCWMDSSCRVTINSAFKSAAQKIVLFCFLLSGINDWILLCKMMSTMQRQWDQKVYLCLLKGWL